MTGFISQVPELTGLIGQVPGYYTPIILIYILIINFILNTFA